MLPRDARIKYERAPLYLQARRRLLAMIESGAFPRGSRLPREGVLAEALGVSRPTVREALGLLQIEGMVTRRHGAGSFVAHGPRGITARLDELISIPQVIAANGYRPRMAGLAVERIAPPRAAAEALALDRGEPVYRVRRVYLAGRQPAVWVHDYVPAAVVGDQERLRAFDGDMLRFLAEHCGRPVAYAVTTVDVVEADADQAAALRIPRGAGVLRLIQTAYTAANNAVIHSIGYNRAGLIRYSLIRRARA
jgi:GntR family transcriptional regulator